MWKTRVLWIDSVCVDQNNNQIKKMDDVRLTRHKFSQASRVVVWLGYSKYSEVALARMENLLVHARTYVEQLSELGPAIGDPDSFSWRGLKEFFGHPWFGRIWSIPEVASANNVHLRWGGTYLDWDYMKSVMKLLDNPQMLHLMIGAGENLRNVARLIASRDKICGGEIASLADHLFTCSTFQASHPKRQDPNLTKPLERRNRSELSRWKTFSSTNIPKHSPSSPSPGALRRHPPPGWHEPISRFQGLAILGTRLEHRRYQRPLLPLERNRIQCFQNHPRHNPNTKFH